MLGLREDALLFDVHLELEDGTIFGAHRCVLALHSPVFLQWLLPGGVWFGAERAPGGDGGVAGLRHRLPGKASRRDQRAARVLLPR